MIWTIHQELKIWIYSVFRNLHWSVAPIWNVTRVSHTSNGDHQSPNSLFSSVWKFQIISPIRKHFQIMFHSGILNLIISQCQSNFKIAIAIWSKFVCVIQFDNLLLAFFQKDEFSLIELLRNSFNWIRFLSAGFKKGNFWIWFWISIFYYFFG